MRFALALLLAVGSLPAVLTGAPVPKEMKAKKDVDRLVGVWASTAPQQDGGWFEFAADGTLRTWVGPRREHLAVWTWAVVDPNASPKKAKITRTTAPAGQAFDCVYELDGDTLKFALVMNPEKGVPAKVERHPALQFFETARDKSGK